MSRLNKLKLSNVPIEDMRECPLHMLDSFTLEFSDGGLCTARYANRNGHSYVRLESNSLRSNELRETAETIRRIVYGISVDPVEKDRSEYNYYTRINLPGPLTNPYDTIQAYQNAFEGVRISEVVLGPFGKLPMDRARAFDSTLSYSI